MRPATDALAMQRELRQALERDELSCTTSPRSTCRPATHGVEALLRWQHPQRGLLAPSEFLPPPRRPG